MEQWKDVVGAEGVYAVSDAGSVRNQLTGSAVKPYWQGKYLAFTIHRSGRRQIVRLHTAVLEAFAGPRPSGKVGAHLDGDASNCTFANLAWATPAENESHKIGHGTDARGEKSTQARFTNAEAELVRKAHALGMAIAEVARLTRVNPATIHKIVSGKRYCH